MNNQVLDLINPNNSDIKYKLGTFPDGEDYIELNEINRKDTICVKCRIRNAKELFILSQVFDILDRQEVKYKVEVFYLMGMRMDRVMDFNKPFTLKLVANVFHNCNAYQIDFVELHSDRIGTLYPNELRFSEMYIQELDLYSEQDNFVLGEDVQLCFPDQGAYDRYTGYVYEPWGKILIGKKVRDPETGKILNIDIENPNDIDGRPILVMDDLCDGGGTFVGIAEAIRKYTNVPLYIRVVHMVNPNGLLNLSQNYDKVWITDSYKDWKGEYGNAFPDNVIQINITDIKR